jgi:hypothetical protein
MDIGSSLAEGKSTTENRDLMLDFHEVVGICDRSLSRGAPRVQEADR